MRKLLFWSAVTLFAAVSCNKEIETPVVPENNAPESFVATVDGGAATKTVMGDAVEEDGKTKYTQFWNGDEEIIVFGNNSTKKTYKAEGVDKQSTATFVRQGTETLSGDSYLAAYPASMNGTYAYREENSLKKLWLKNSQNATENSYDPEAHASVATTPSSSNTLSFKNAGALIKFTVEEEGITVVRFYKEGAALAGNFNVTFGADGLPVMNFEGCDTEPSITLSGTFANGKDYFISTMSNVTLNGFTIEFEKGGKLYRRSSGKDLVLNRNSIIYLGAMSTASYTEVTETETYSDIYFKPESWWGSDGAVIKAYVYSEISGKDQMIDMVKSDEANGIYTCSVSNNFTKVTFCRTNPTITGDNIWDDANMWNKIEGLTLPSDASNCYNQDYGIWETLDLVLNPVWSIVGGINRWTLTDNTYQMTKEGDYYVYKGLEMSADLISDNNNELKFARNYRWEGSLTGTFAGADAAMDLMSSNENITVTEAATYDVYLDLIENKAYFMTGGKTPDDLVPVPTYDWYLVGTFNGWNPGDPAYGMTLDGDYYKFSNLKLEATDNNSESHEVKFAAGNWDNTYSHEGAIEANTAIALTNGGNNMIVPVGEYDVYLSKDLTKAYFMTDGKTPEQAVVPEEPVYNWGVIGINGWNDGDDIAMTLDGDWYIAKNILIKNSTGFKFRVDGKWDQQRGGYSLIAENDTPYDVYGENPGDIYVAVSAYYDVYLSRDATKMKVVKVGDYEEEPEIPVVPENSITLYLKPNSNWLVDSARFAVYCFGNGEAWVDMTDEDGDGFYEAAISKDYPNVIFCRMNPGTSANNWGSKWNQTGNLTVPTDGTNCYTVADGTWDNGGGTWSTYSAN